MSNRYPKVFVMSNVGTKFVTTNTVKPSQLTSGQVGLHLVDQFEIPGVGVGLTPGATVPAIQIHQNVGDTKYGTVRSKRIERARVKAYYGASAGVGQTAISYIGYDTVDNTKDINVPCGKEFGITIGVQDNTLNNFYLHNPSYRKTIVVNTGCCNVNNDNADRDTIADFLVAAINATNTPQNDYKSGSELPNFVTATKVTTGTPGLADYRVGVKIETKAITPQLLNACDPIKMAEVNLTQIYVSFDGGRECGFNVPVTEARVAKPGTGYPAFVAQAEAESQGFDRIRETFENIRFQNNYGSVVSYAVDGTKYDYLFLDFEWEHNSDQGGASPKAFKDPYQAIFIAPTGTLQPVADVLNSWLTGLFPAVTL